MGSGAARTGAAALCATVAGIAAGLLAQSPASAAQGAQVRITELPPQFRAGAAPATVTVVVSKRTPGDCLKVRWSMVIRVDGLRLDQVQFDRVEENGSFPVDVQAQSDDLARLTDKRLDPGQLCPDRTVTARYRFRFDERVADARVTFEAQALDASRRLLERASASRSVRGRAAAPATTPARTAAPTPTEEAVVPPGDTADPAGVPPADDPPPAATGASSISGLGVPPIGFIVGALMVFLGVSLLFRLRRQLRRGPAPALVRQRPPAWDGQGGRDHPGQRWAGRPRRPRLRRG